MKQCGIYRIVCLQNLKSYFGSSSDFSVRKTQHKQQLNGNRHHNIILQRAWNKYGKDLFVFEFIEEVDEKDLLIREQIYLDMMFDGKKLLGFNISRDAKSPGAGRIWTDFSRNKIRQTRLLRGCGKGIIPSKEKRSKISKSLMGKAGGRRNSGKGYHKRSNGNYKVRVTTGINKKFIKTVKTEAEAIELVKQIRADIKCQCIKNY